MEVRDEVLRLHIASKPLPPTREARFDYQFTASNLQQLNDGSAWEVVRRAMTDQGFIPCLPTEISADHMGIMTAVNEQDEGYFLVSLSIVLKRTDGAYQELCGKYTADLQRWTEVSARYNERFVKLFQVEVNALAEKYGFQDADMSKQRKSK